MNYIDNLSSFVKLAVDKDLTGVYFPQNFGYICTAKMARCIAISLNQKIHFECLTVWIICFLRLFIPIVKKAFGSLIYKETEDFNYSYIVTDNEEGILQSVE